MLFLRLGVPNLMLISVLALMVLSVLIAAWRLIGILIGVVTEVGRATGTIHDQAYDARAIWTAHGIRTAEAAFYLLCAFLLGAS